jgi:hypothetical protein
MTLRDVLDDAPALPADFDKARAKLDISIDLARMARARQFLADQCEERVDYTLRWPEMKAPEKKKKK